MIDLYLKTDSELNMTTILTIAGILDKNGNILSEVSVDHIGPITRVLDYDSSTIKTYPEWHTNLRGNFTEEQLVELLPISITPNNPYRIWAGTL
jgi:hypothetical protein